MLALSLSPISFSPTISEVEEPGVSIQRLSLRTIPSTACPRPASPLCSTLPGTNARMELGGQEREDRAVALPLENERENRRPWRTAVCNQPYRVLCCVKSLNDSSFPSARETARESHPAGGALGGHGLHLHLQVRAGSVQACGSRHKPELYHQMAISQSPLVFFPSVYPPLLSSPSSLTAVKHILLGDDHLFGFSSEMG